ncbi:MAG: type toxin-antitoxin system VapC family toxin [Mucilaginibacter sp.]|nr:type toxin-antitoxin system VapC family toxin [Mucilaginibacter sp.]
MENNLILIDTSILIDYFRKSDKANSKLISLINEGYKFQISAITEFEIYAGSTAVQQTFWENLLKKIEVLPFDSKTVKIAVEINTVLKRKRKQIEIADLFIASTAISKNIAFATLNRKHFERIENLQIVD